MVRFSVFNELSLPFSTNVNVVEAFNCFFKLLTEIKNKGLDTLRMSDDFKNYEILENVNFQQFVGQQIDRDFERKILSFLANGVILIDSPIIKDEDDNEHDIMCGSEYFYSQQETSGGLACCDIWGTLAISFNSDTKWDTDKIILKRNDLSDDGGIVERNINIRHSSKSKHLQMHQPFFDDLEKELKLNITQENFWKKRASFFPNVIVFCPEVESQITKLDKGMFQQAISILRDVESKRKSITEFKHNGEGQTVRNNPILKRMRCFTIDNKKVFFEQHVKSLPNSYRIYYLEQSENVHIGYIGKHLKGKKDK